MAKQKINRNLPPGDSTQHFLRTRIPPRARLGMGSLTVEPISGVCTGLRSPECSGTHPLNAYGMHAKLTTSRSHYSLQGDLFPYQRDYAFGEVGVPRREFILGGPRTVWRYYMWRQKQPGFEASVVHFSFCSSKMVYCGLRIASLTHKRYFDLQQSRA